MYRNSELDFYDIIFFVFVVFFLLILGGSLVGCTADGDYGSPVVDETSQTGNPEQITATVGGKIHMDGNFSISLNRNIVSTCGPATECMVSVAIKGVYTVAPTNVDGYYYFPSTVDVQKNGNFILDWTSTTDESPRWAADTLDGLFSSEEDGACTISTDLDKNGNFVIDFSDWDMSGVVEQSSYNGIGNGCEITGSVISEKEITYAYTCAKISGSGTLRFDG